MEPARREGGDEARKLLTVIGRAATTNLSLVVAGTAAVGAAALSSLPVLAVGGATYLALVAWDTFDPEFWKKTFAPKREPPRLPDPERFADPSLKKAALALVSARRERELVLADVPKEIRMQMASPLLSVEELEAGAARLLERGEALLSWLRRVDGRAVREESRELDERSRKASNPEIRVELERAREAKDEHARHLGDLESSAERLLANLARIVATLEGFPAQAMKLRALDEQASEGVFGDLGRRLDGVNVEMKEFERTLETISEAHAS